MQRIKAELAQAGYSNLEYMGNDVLIYEAMSSIGGETFVEISQEGDDLFHLSIFEGIGLDKINGHTWMFKSDRFGNPMLDKDGEYVPLSERDQKKLEKQIRVIKVQGKDNVILEFLKI